MTPGQGLALEHMEYDVDEARMAYVKAQNARQPSVHLWNEYARQLHALRLHKRRMNDANV